MNTSTNVNLRDRLKAIHASSVILLDTYKDIIATNEAEASQLRDYCIDTVGKLRRKIKLLESHIAKMDREHTPIDHPSTPSKK